MRYIAEDSPPRRAARTLEQAFGPHTSRHIDEPPEPPGGHRASARHRLLAGRRCAARGDVLRARVVAEGAAPMNPQPEKERMNATNAAAHQAGPVVMIEGEEIVDRDFDRLLRKTPSARELMLETESFGKMMRIAELMANSRVTVPKHLLGNTGDCMAIVMQAMRWDMDPFAVAQKTHVVNGALGYEAQLVNAVVEASGAIRGHFHYGFRGDGAAAEVRVGAYLAGDADITWGEWLSVGSVKVKNSPLWATNPKQQLGYLQVKNFARLYCPGAILGVYTPEELAEREPDDDEPARERGPRRKSAAAAAIDAAAVPEATPGTATTTTEAVAAAGGTQPAQTAPAKAGPAGSISGGQVAYLRNKLQAAGLAETGICDRYQIAGIEHLSAEQFDTVKAELLAAV
jgi:hypothetical protein